MENDGLVLLLQNLLAQIADLRKEICGRFDDHDKRIRYLERWKAGAVGIIGAVTLFVNVAVAWFWRK